MTRLTHTLFATAALCLCAVSAQAGDMQDLVDQCTTDASSARAVLACTELSRHADSDTLQGQIIAKRALHRVALGNHAAAASDFDRAAQLTQDPAMASLGTAFAAVSDRDLATAQARFEDCGAQGSLASVAHYGLGLTHDMAGRPDEARASFQQALALRPDWDVAAEKVRRLG